MAKGKKIAADFTVLENSPAGSTYFRLKLKSPSALPDIIPGQFVQALVDGSKTTFLRRPFSIHDIGGDDTLSLLINKVGDGSRALSRLKPGDRLNLMLPLGNGFSLPAAGSRTLLIGGGVGIAPMLLLGRKLSRDCEVSFLFGFRSKSYIIDLGEMERLGTVCLTTEDGSAGEKGFVTGHSVLNGSFDKIYACGPEPMMKAVAALAREKGISCEVSLENKMACGLGACLCCVTKTKEGHKCVCTDGPVFDINDLPW